MEEIYWKLQKKTVNGVTTQEKVKLTDATLEQLKDWSVLCGMILNGRYGNSGKKKKLQSLDIVRDKIHAEMAVRADVQRLNRTDPSYATTDRNILLKELVSGPYSLMDLGDKMWPFPGCKKSNLEKACTNRLGKLSEKAIPLDFILKQGVTKSDGFYTTEEVGEYLNLSSSDSVKFLNNGIDITVMKSVLESFNKDYSDIPSQALDCLHNRIIPLYSAIIQKQVKKFETLSDAIMREIERRR